MSHDQLSKSLITTFFHDFLCLAVPDVAPRLRSGEAVFLDKELCLDWPTGNRRELDLLAKVPVDKRDMEVLVHVEIESRASSGMDRRLWSYYMQIRLRYDLLVLPILVNLRGGTPGADLEILAEGVETAAPVVFPYRVLGLSGCQAEDWLARSEPIAWAFAALMKSRSWSRAELKMECLRRVARSGVTGFRKEVLVNWLASCVRLTGKNAAEYKRLFELEENKEIEKMDTSYLGKAEARGVKKGLAQGIEKGKAQGKAEAVETMRQAVLQGLERRFGRVPRRVQRCLEAISSIERLAELIAELPLVESVDDLVERDRVAS